MEAPHRSGAEASVFHTVILFHSSARFDLVVELLKFQCGQLTQFDITKGRGDVVLDVVAVILRRGFPDIWLAVILVPQSAPLRYCILFRLEHIDFLIFFDGLL